MDLRARHRSCRFHPGHKSRPKGKKCFVLMLSLLLTIRLAAGQTKSGTKKSSSSKGGSSSGFGLGGMGGSKQDQQPETGVSPANLGGQPAWLPPTPSWDIQPWESPPVGGGAPPEGVVYHSNIQTFPPSISQDHRFPYREAHSYPAQTSPIMPMPGPGAAPSGRGRIVNQPYPYRLDGGIAGAAASGPCYAACVRTGSIGGTTSAQRTMMVQACMQKCGYGSGAAPTMIVTPPPGPHGAVPSSSAAVSATSPTLGFSNARTQCILRCATMGAHAIASFNAHAAGKYLGEKQKMEMSNACMAGCAHSSSFTWHGLPSAAAGYGFVGPSQIHPAPAAVFYGPPSPQLQQPSFLQTKDPLTEKAGPPASSEDSYNVEPSASNSADFGAQNSQGGFDSAQLDYPDLNTLTSQAEEPMGKSQVNPRLENDYATQDKFDSATSATSYPYYGNNNAVPGMAGGVFHPEGVFANVAPITSCVMQCMNMGMAAMKESKTSPYGVAGATMSQSCMRGCHNGLNPFMFNWATPGMPGNLEAWGALHPGAHAIPEVLGAPVDGTSCVMQCMSMGGEAMAASLTKNARVEPSQEDKQRMWLSCQQGCAAGSPFMFNWKDPSSPGDIAPYAANPFLSGVSSLWAHPYALALARRPQSHASCVMMCLSMGKDAMDQDCLLNPQLEKCNSRSRGMSGTGKTSAKSSSQKRRKLLMNKIGSGGQSSAVKPCTSETDCKTRRDIASQKISQSCMQGCSIGIPFMFNWTAPMFPGIPAMTSFTGAGLTAPTFSSFLFGGGADILRPSSLSPFNTLASIANGPTDRASCVMQCLSMGHDAAKRNDDFIKAYEKEAKALGMDYVTPLQRNQMVLTCGRGCDAGTPFMFNFTSPSMPGLPQVPNDPKMPFGTSWNAPLLPGLPPVPLYPKFMSPGGSHHAFYGAVYNFTNPFYPFIGHPNGVSGGFQSAGKGHLICLAKQLAAFLQDPAYKSEKKNSPKRNAGLADFVRPCQVYVMVQFGPKFGVESGTTPPLPGSGVTGFGNLRGGTSVPRFNAQSGGDTQNVEATLSKLGLFLQESERVMHLQRHRFLKSELKNRKQLNSVWRYSSSTKDLSGPSSFASPGQEVSGVYLPASASSNIQIPPIPIGPEKSPLESARRASLAYASESALLPHPLATAAAPEIRQVETNFIERNRVQNGMGPQDFQYPTAAPAEVWGR